jgi:hypothetical protein
VDGVDPTAQTEDLGDDAVAATRYGLMNIARVAEMLVRATTREGEDYSNLQEVYGQLVAQRNRELGHVANLPGGVVRTSRVAGENGVVYSPVPARRQRAALAFLLEEGFKTPRVILRPDILALIEPSGIAERILQGQRTLLAILLDNGRLGRMATQQALATQAAGAYPLGDFFRDLQGGIWSEFTARSVTTDLYRRNLQRAYIEMLGAKLNAPPPAPVLPGPPGAPPAVQPPALPGEARGLIRDQLTSLDRMLANALPRVADRETRAHVADSRYQIQRILHPENR